MDVRLDNSDPPIPPTHLPRCTWRAVVRPVPARGPPPAVGADRIVVVCALLGGLYYATATRFYQAKASLLVLQTGSDVDQYHDDRRRRSTRG